MFIRQIYSVTSGTTLHIYMETESLDSSGEHAHTHTHTHTHTLKHAPTQTQIFE